MGLVRDRFTPAAFMWLMAIAIYLGFKWVTFRHGVARDPGASLGARALYLLVWPGMKFGEFCSPPPRRPEDARPPRWVPPFLRMTTGATLVWLGVPAVPAEFPLIQGWVGMIGTIMMLHFGSFDLLAQALQAAGWNARPNMNAPFRAQSLADFWGNRWNTAFNTLADRYAFRPLKARFGPRFALLAVFLASGVIHELVITLPARGAYGLPTLYFLLQGAGLLLERKPAIRRRPVVRRLLGWVFLLVPLGCLFPPRFVEGVMLPMLHAITLKPVTP